MLKEIKLIQIWLGTKFYEFEDLLVRKGKKATGRSAGEVDP
jgi:hypothetical protein